MTQITIVTKNLSIFGDANQCQPEFHWLGIGEETSWHSNYLKTNRILWWTVPGPKESADDLGGLGIVGTAIATVVAEHIAMCFEVRQFQIN